MNGEHRKDLIETRRRTEIPKGQDLPKGRTTIVKFPLKGSTGTIGTAA